MSLDRPPLEVRVEHTGEKRFSAKGAHLELEFDTTQTSPKELFLAGMLGCSAYDMVMIPASRGYEIKNLSLSVKAHPSAELPHRFERLELLYQLDSTAPKEEILSWVEATLESYCTTINTLRGGCEVSYSVLCNKEMILSQRKLF
jgi:putative redox protein